MEPRNEFSCIRVNMDDMASLEEVSELYFREREDEHIDEDDSPWSDSSSESGEDERYDEESEMFTDTSESDLSEEAKVRTFYENTCNCTLAEGDRPCSTTLSLDDYSDSRNNCLELSSLELDLVILGAIQSSLNCSSFSVSGRSESQRKRSRITFITTQKEFVRSLFCSFIV